MAIWQGKLVVFTPYLFTMFRSTMFFIGAHWVWHQPARLIAKTSNSKPWTVRLVLGCHAFLMMVNIMDAWDTRTLLSIVYDGPPSKEEPIQWHHLTSISHFTHPSKNKTLNLRLKPQTSFDKGTGASKLHGINTLLRCLCCSMGRKALHKLFCHPCSPSWAELQRLFALLIVSILEHPDIRSIPETHASGLEAFVQQKNVERVQCSRPFLGWRSNVT